MQANIVTDPEAVVVEFVGATIAPLTVLRVAKHVRVAHTAVKVELCRVKDDVLLASLSLTCPISALQ